MTALAPGRMVTPNVRLVRHLGDGGMGSVWVATHLRLESEVAVKFIDPLLIQQQPSIRARFRREATAAAKIDSPHVVRTFDHGEMDDGTPFIVMELMRGESLADRIHRSGPLGLRDTELVVVQVCKALRMAHKLGIVHRDIKPDNVFLVGQLHDAGDDDALGAGDELFVKILDFGIAKEVNREGSLATMAGSLLGTPYYMSPEQILSSKDVDFRADLWAVAVMAYECLTGSLPFNGETLGGVIAAVVSGRFTPPSALAYGLFGVLDSWFARALAMDPSERFGSTRELSNAFAAAVKLATDASFGGSPLSVSHAGSQQKPMAFALNETAVKAPDLDSLSWDIKREGTAPAGAPAQARAMPPAPRDASAANTAASWGSGTLASGNLPDAGRSRRGLWLGFGAAAMVVGIGSFLVLRSGGSTADGARANAPASNAPASNAPVVVIATSSPPGAGFALHETPSASGAPSSPTAGLPAATPALRSTLPALKAPATTSASRPMPSARPSRAAPSKHEGLL